MPGGDGTGPMGMGPMTGRAAGYCAGYSAPGYLNPIPGRGFGRGVYGAYGLGRAWGRGAWGGRGHRNWYYATGLTGWQRAAAGWPAWRPPVPAGTPGAPPWNPALTREQQLDVLKGQAEYFEDVLDGIRRRIDELEKKTGE